MKKVILVGVCVVVIIILSGCIEQAGNLSNPDIKNLNLVIENISLERTSYTANEVIKFNVSVRSNMNVNNVSLRVYGITSRQGTNLIDDIKILNLTKGVTTMNYNAIAPWCTRGCGALYYPGSYAINAEIKYENKLLNFTISNITSINVNLY